MPYARGFIPVNVGRILIEFQTAIAQASKNGNVAIARALRAEQLTFIEEMQILALGTAKLADRNIKARIDATQKRPSTGNKPGLRGSIVSRPIRIGGMSLGAVGIADTTLLDALRNPRTPEYGSFWRAQEHGTGGEVPSQVGRRIYGLFMGAGGASEPPRRQYRGGGPHPVFVPTKGGSNVAASKGGKGGPGEISVEIAGRHFIRDGANAARAEWEIGLRRIERSSIRRLAAIGVTGEAPAGRRRPRARPRRRF